jgi:hypothetical protein
MDSVQESKVYLGWRQKLMSTKASSRLIKEIGRCHRRRGTERGSKIEK